MASMSHTLALRSQFRQWLAPPPVRVAIHVDHAVPGSHLIWNIENASERPVTLTKLVVRGKGAKETPALLASPHVLAPHESLVLPTDVDWSLLSAESVAVVDADGKQHPAPHRQFVAVRDQLRATIDRRASRLTAGEFLFGAADMAFGVMILGLAFFMLMWAIANG